ARAVGAGPSAWPGAGAMPARSGPGAAVSPLAQPCRIASSTRPAPAAPSSSTRSSSRRGCRPGGAESLPAVMVASLSQLVAVLGSQLGPSRSLCFPGSAALPSRGLVAYHRTMRYARDERLALCALLDSAGPREPTLCEGWDTRDLAAHLVLREHRPDAGAGLLGGPLAGYTRRVQRKLAERTPYPRLVEAIRSGPPRLSVFWLPGMDERINLVEYFVHHEDVRRAQPGWEPRELGPGLADVLWQRLGMVRFLLRKAPVGVELARDDGPESERG